MAVAKIVPILPNQVQHTFSVSHCDLGIVESQRQFGGGDDAFGVHPNDFRR